MQYKIRSIRLGDGTYVYVVSRKPSWFSSWFPFGWTAQTSTFAEAKELIPDGEPYHVESAEY